MALFMIYYLVTADHCYTLHWFLSEWEPSMDGRFEILLYERLADIDHFPDGAYIFSDLDRLTPAMRTDAEHLWNRLHHEGKRLLNHPRRSLGRYELLRDLAARGENAFQIHRVSETRTPDRFPVFLRPDRAHEICSDLLHDQSAVDRAIAGAVAAGHSLTDLLMVEFCDIADGEGIYHRYSCFLVGARTVANKLHHQRRDWIVRTDEEMDLLTAGRAQEIWANLRNDQHSAWVKDVCRAANIQYGRIDYSMLNGKPQVWEINTNPTILPPHSHVSGKTMPMRLFVAAGLRAAFEALDAGD